MSGAAPPAHLGRAEEEAAADHASAPRVSVVIPAFNAAPHLELALRSALEQTERDIEVLVVDDASVDGTHDLALRAAAGDGRVRVLRNPVNAGVAASRNRAFSVARGQWIALLDADDGWLPDRLERLLAAAGAADVVADDVLVRRADEGRALQDNRLPSFLEWADLNIRSPHRLTAVELVRHDLGFLKPMMRRAFLEEHGICYDADLRLAEDFYLYVRLLLAGARWVQLREGYYAYTRRDGSLSRDSEAIFRQHVTGSAALLEQPAVRADAELWRVVRRFHHGARGRETKHVLLTLARQRRAGQMLRVARSHPQDTLLALRIIGYNLGLRLRRRARHPVRPVRARLLD